MAAHFKTDLEEDIFAEKREQCQRKILRLYFLQLHVKHHLYSMFHSFHGLILTQQIGVLLMCRSSELRWKRTAVLTQMQ